MLPLSSHIISAFSQGHPVAASSSSSSRSPYLSFNKVFYKAVPTQNVAYLFSLSSSYCWYYIALLSSSTLCTLTPFHFSHDWSSWSYPPFSSNIFKNSPAIPGLLFEMSKFQHHTKECSKCSISRAHSPLNLSQICWWQQSSYRIVSHVLS